MVKPLGSSLIISMRLPILFPKKIRGRSMARYNRRPLGTGSHVNSRSQCNVKTSWVELCLGGLKERLVIFVFYKYR